MMFVYIRKHKLPEVYARVSDLTYQLKHNTWTNSDKTVKYSPMSVITNPESNPMEYKKIMTVDLSYPIIITTDGIIIDGMHRLSRSFIEKKEHITAYMFDSKLLHKFIIAKKDEWQKVHSMTIYDFINLYTDRFHK